MSGRNISLMDVHGACASLAFAVSQCIGKNRAEVKVEWHPISYLAVEIGCYGRHVQMIADKLSHGVLQGPYDYRFTVSKPVGVPDDEWTYMRAYPDIDHHDKLVRKATA